jgi:hypothetical protein
MSYKITSFNQQTGAITVVYDEGITVSLTLVPDTEGKVITGQTLDNFILSAKPVWQIEALKQQTQLETTGITNANEIFALVTDPVVKDPILDVSLDKAMEYVNTAIAATVTGIRNNYLTNLLGQEEAYNVKYEQAKAYQAANFSGEVPSYLAAEISISGSSAAELALAVIEKHEFYADKIAPVLEGSRSGIKAAMAQCKTVQEIDDIYRKVNSQLQKLVPVTNTTTAS